MPATLGAVVACGVVGYLDPAERTGLWRLLAERLRPGDPAVVDVMPVPAPMVVPRTRIAGREIGAHRHSVWISGTPGSGDEQHWTMRYEVERAGTVVRHLETAHTWRVVGLDRIAEEAGQAGLTFTRLSDQVAVLSPAR